MKLTLYLVDPKGTRVLGYRYVTVDGDGPPLSPEAFNWAHGKMMELARHVAATLGPTLGAAVGLEDVDGFTNVRGATAVGHVPLATLVAHLPTLREMWKCPDVVPVVIHDDRPGGRGANTN